MDLCLVFWSNVTGNLDVMGPGAKPLHELRKQLYRVQTVRRNKTAITAGRVRHSKPDHRAESPAMTNAMKNANPKRWISLQQGGRQAQGRVLTFIVEDNYLGIE